MQILKGPKPKPLSCFDCKVEDTKPISASPMIHLELSIPEARHPVHLCRGCIWRRHGGREDSGRRMAA
jgi:hypothetical protein